MVTKRKYGDLTEKQKERIVRSAMRLYKQWRFAHKEADDEIQELCLVLESTGLCEGLYQ